jgi:hypothetical protein
LDNRRGDKADRRGDGVVTTCENHDVSKRFPMIVAAVAPLPMLTLAAVTYCTAVGETVVSLKELPGDNSGFSGAKAATLPSAVRLFWTLS